MLDSVMQFIGPMVGFASNAYGPIGEWAAYFVLIGIPVLSVSIEMLEFAVALTSSKKDDVFAAKVRSAWGKALPVLEILPHANIPLSAAMLKIVDYSKRGAAALKGLILGWYKG